MVKLDVYTSVNNCGLYYRGCVHDFDRVNAGGHLVKRVVGWFECWEEILEDYYVILRAIILLQKWSAMFIQSILMWYIILSVSSLKKFKSYGRK